MMGQNIFQKVVKNALIEEDWHLTNENFELNFGENAELGTEFLLLCEKGDKKIGILVEYFLSASPVQDFYVAFGRHLNCRLLLSKIDSSRTLFSAVTTEDYENVIKGSLFEENAKSQQMKMIIFDFQAENIKHWINHQEQNFKIRSPHLINKKDAVLFERTIEDIL